MDIRHVFVYSPGHGIVRRGQNNNSIQAVQCPRPMRDWNWSTDTLAFGGVVHIIFQLRTCPCHPLDADPLLPPGTSEVLRSTYLRVVKLRVYLLEAEQNADGPIKM